MLEWQLAAVRASYEAFDARDFEAVKALYAEDCTWEMQHEIVFNTTWHGHAGLIEMYEQVLEGSDGLRIELVHAAPLTPRLLTARGRSSWRGDASGLPVVIEYDQLITFAADRRIRRVLNFVADRPEFAVIRGELVVRECFEAFDAGDIEGALACLSEDVEWINGDAVLDVPAVVSGRDAMRAYWTRMVSEIPFRHVDKRFAVEGGTVTTSARIAMEGPGTGLPFEQPCTYVSHIGADGLIERAQFEFDPPA